jgi:hypothetical protein
LRIRLCLSNLISRGLSIPCSSILFCATWWTTGRLPLPRVLLCWFLTHHLRFQLFDCVWWWSQRRGTQQGGSHSPTLFGRVVAGRFHELASSWRQRGELPAFHADRLLLWALWFIDDAILLFRNLLQLSRLLPEVLTLFASMGLSVNVAKSCLFGLRLPRVPPTCLNGYATSSGSTYLGQRIRLIEGDEHMVASLCRRAMTAFFANRPLLTHRAAPRCRKLCLFSSMVTAAIRWSLCVVSVRQSNLGSLRVHFVTLLAWMLGARAHNSWKFLVCSRMPPSSSTCSEAVGKDL